MGMKHELMNGCISIATNVSLPSSNLLELLLCKPFFFLWEKKTKLKSSFHFHFVCFGAIFAVIFSRFQSFCFTNMKKHWENKGQCLLLLHFHEFQCNVKVLVWLTDTNDCVYIVKCDMKWYTENSYVFTRCTIHFIRDQGFLNQENTYGTCGTKNDNNKNEIACKHFCLFSKWWWKYADSWMKIKVKINVKLKKSWNEELAMPTKNY